MSTPASRLSELGLDVDLGLVSWYDRLADADLPAVNDGFARPTVSLSTVGGRSTATVTNHFRNASAYDERWRVLEINDGRFGSQEPLQHPPKTKTADRCGAARTHTPVGRRYCCSVAANKVGTREYQSSTISHTHTKDAHRMDLMAAR